jgi:hypothetical protein
MITEQIYKKEIENELTSIFIPNTNEIIKNKRYEIIETDNRYETTIYTTSNENILTTTIFTNLNEIYCEKIKEITIQRQRLFNKKINLEEIKLYVPLIDDKIIYENEGDDYIDQENNLKRGDIIIRIKCKKHKMITRVNDYDLLLKMEIKMEELFYGFNYKFKYFNNEELDIETKEPLKEYNFDGEKMVIKIENKGLPFTDELNNKKRGILIIHLKLYKNKNFRENIKKYFN